jgi:hypothetical protein
VSVTMPLYFAIVKGNMDGEMGECANCGIMLVTG